MRRSYGSLVYNTNIIQKQIDYLDRWDHPMQVSIREDIHSCMNHLYCYRCENIHHYPPNTHSYLLN